MAIEGNHDREKNTPTSPRTKAAAAIATAQ
jgi:hypothetical protein